MATQPGWFDRFDERARHALQHAREESERDGLAYIGTEQLLLGLLAEPRSIARRVLRSFGLETDAVRPVLQELRQISAEHSNTEVGQAAPSSGDIKLTPDGKRMIELGVERARTLGHHSIGTEHLLLGLLDLPQGAVADLLRHRGVDFEALRARTLQSATRNLARSTRRVRVAGDLPHIGAVEGARWPAPLAPATRNNVVMCRLDDAALDAIDTLIEAGVRANRSDAAGWLINVGLESKSAVLDAVRDKVADIRRIREDARAVAENLESQQ